jgi:hypothetical protein
MLELQDELLCLLATPQLIEMTVVADGKAQ